MATPDKAPRAKRAALGEALEFTADPMEVIGPDGIPVLVTGGRYIFDRPGTHTVGGQDYTVK